MRLLNGQKGGEVVVGGGGSGRGRGRAYRKGRG